MSISVGIGLSFVAMLCWGIGDFFIQKGTRKVGNIETLFIICLFGSIVLFPFVWRDFGGIFDTADAFILFGGALILFVAAILDFEALKIGKLSVVEPIWSLEIPAAAVLAFVVLGETIFAFQTAVIVLLVAGLMLVSFKEKYSVKKFLVEKGVFLAFFAAFVMGVANFFIGWGSRISDPLMVNFVINSVIVLLTGIHLLARGHLGKTFKDFRRNAGLFLPMAIADNSAWVAFAFAMSIAPIAIAVALSESYIIVAVLLGLFVNKERLQRHQKFGLVLALLSAVVLAGVTI